MGFTEGQAAQAFFACDKNEMLAANYLFENSESLHQEEQGVPPHIEVKKEEQKKQQ